MPRARIERENRRATEWHSKALLRYRRLTKKEEELIVSVHLSGTSTRCIKHALHALFKIAMSKRMCSVEPSAR